MLIECGMNPRDGNYLCSDHDTKVLCSRYLGGVFPKTAAVLRYHSTPPIVWTSVQIRRLGAAKAYDILCEGCDRGVYPESARPIFQPVGSKRSAGPQSSNVANGTEGNGYVPRD